LIRLHSSQSTLIEQLRHFPKADHDDGPDCLHMLWALAVSGSARIEYTSVKRHDHGGRFGSGGWWENLWLKLSIYTVTRCKVKP
jgi:hypothetical protein